jgi:hypothetical protein
MIKIPLLIVSTLAGVWNVLRDVSESVKHKACVFMLGFCFCYGSAVLAEYYGFSSEVAAFFGYVCGVLSNQIYDALSKIVKNSPEVIGQKIGVTKNGLVKKAKKPAKKGKRANESDCK